MRNLVSLLTLERYIIGVLPVASAVPFVYKAAVHTGSGRNYMDGMNGMRHAILVSSVTRIGRRRFLVRRSYELLSLKSQLIIK